MVTMALRSLTRRSLYLEAKIVVYQATAIVAAFGARHVRAGRGYSYSMWASIFGPPVLKNRTRSSAAMARKMMFKTVV